MIILCKFFFGSLVISTVFKSEVIAVSKNLKILCQTLILNFYHDFYNFFFDWDEIRIKWNKMT